MSRPDPTVVPRPPSPVPRPPSPVATPSPRSVLADLLDALDEFCAEQLLLGAEEYDASQRARDNCHFERAARHQGWHDARTSLAARVSGIANRFRGA